jgi:DNA-binding MarR family transcriptional regulator
MLDDGPLDDTPLDDGPHHDVLGLLLRLVNQHWGEGVHVALQAAGLDGIRAPHANVIPFVPADGIQVSELARAASMRKQSMAEAVEQLERAGYVERRPDPRDRRARLVFLTERGHQVRSVAVAAGRRVEADWAGLTSPEEIAALRATLLRLLERLRGRDQ